MAELARSHEIGTINVLAVLLMLGLDGQSATGSAAGPASHQKGTVTLKGHDGLRALAAMTVATTERPAERGQQSCAVLPFALGLVPW